MSELKKGDVVYLKSGGPRMTIQNIGDYTRIKNGACCIWFDGKKKYEDVFDLDTLELADEPDDSGVTIQRG